MEYLDDLTTQIFSTTEKIQDVFPELIKYLEEIPRNFQYTSEKEVNRRALKEYLDSLNILFETYTKQHQQL